MTNLVPATEIEGIVGVPRHPTLHHGRAVSAEETVYILHSHQCLADFEDLRDCPYSIALDDGIQIGLWVEDVPVVLAIDPDLGLIPTLNEETR